MSIPLSAPDISEDDIQAVVDVLRTPRLSMGPRQAAFEASVAAYTGASHAVALLRAQRACIWVLPRSASARATKSSFRRSLLSPPRMPCSTSAPRRYSPISIRAHTQPDRRYCRRRSHAAYARHPGGPHVRMPRRSRTYPRTCRQASDPGDRRCASRSPRRQSGPCRRLRPSAISVCSDFIPTNPLLPAAKAACWSLPVGIWPKPCALPAIRAGRPRGWLARSSFARL